MVVSGKAVIEEKTFNIINAREASKKVSVKATKFCKSKTSSVERA